MELIKNNKDFYQVDKLREGDAGAFDQLFRDYSHRLYQFAFKYLKSSEEAEEVIQEVFLKVWEKRKDLKPDSSFKSYLYTIAFNFIKKRFIRISKENTFKDEIIYTQLQQENNLDKIIDYKDLLKKVETIVDSMPPRRKEVFIKKKYKELSIKQIAKELEISPNTVENHLVAAQKFIKEQFGEKNIGGMIFYYLFIFE